MCKEEEGLSIKWIFNRTNKFQFYAYHVFKIALSIPMSEWIGLFLWLGQLPRPFIPASVRLVGILPVSLFLIPL